LESSSYRFTGGGKSTGATEAHGGKLRDKRMVSPFHKKGGRNRCGGGKMTADQPPGPMGKSTNRPGKRKKGGFFYRKELHSNND